MDRLSFEEWIDDNPFDITSVMEHFQTEEDFDYSLEKYRDKRERGAFHANDEYINQLEAENEKLKEEVKLINGCVEDCEDTIEVLEAENKKKDERIERLRAALEIYGDEDHYVQEDYYGEEIDPPITEIGYTKAITALREDDKNAQDI